METGQIIFISTEMKHISSQIHTAGIQQTTTRLIAKDEVSSFTVRRYFSLFPNWFPNPVSDCLELEVCQFPVAVRLGQQNTKPTSSPWLSLRLEHELKP